VELEYPALSPGAITNMKCRVYYGSQVVLVTKGRVQTTHDANFDRALSTTQNKLLDYRNTKT
jgi:hypothetical protein